MSDLKGELQVCSYLFRVQVRQVKVWLGFFVGICIVIWKGMSYLQYADVISENINVLELFIIIGNDNISMLLMALGIILVISNAPYLDKDSINVFYRTKKIIWNRGVKLYLLIQGFVYYSVIAISSIVFGFAKGYLANCYSNAMVDMCKGIRYEKSFEIGFNNIELLHSGGPLTIFAITLLGSLLYGLVLEYALYMCCIIFKQNTGVVIAIVFHFVNYELMKEGFMLVSDYSLMAKAMPTIVLPGNSFVEIFSSVAVLLLCLILFSSVTNKAIKYCDIVGA
ncbi:hypothetical protein [Butyrivibrio sp. NC3005]|uniref:hypothetical protein n=1 Tax=Butyrivibrio sp. NC3005 TaxID=1280685 RepID=UPI0004154A33|nr:hypothetical protein [Butyrivibrio sp. NC3005]